MKNRRTLERARKSDTMKGPRTPPKTDWGVSPLARRGVSGTKEKTRSDLLARDGVVAR